MYIAKAVKISSVKTQDLADMRDALPNTLRNLQKQYIYYIGV